MCAGEPRAVRIHCEFDLLRILNPDPAELAQALLFLIPSATHPLSLRSMTEGGPMFSPPADKIPHIEGRYANVFKIGHNALEFIFDFGQLSTDDEQAVYGSRIIVNPVVALEFSRILNAALAQYEKSCCPDPGETVETARHG